MALQKEIYCIYQPNQYQISWDKYFQRSQAGDGACSLEPRVLGETGTFFAYHTETESRKCSQAGAPTLSCSLSQFICCLETYKGKGREGWKSEGFA